MKRIALIVSLAVLGSCAGDKPVVASDADGTNGRFDLLAVGDGSPGDGAEAHDGAVLHDGAPAHDGAVLHDGAPGQGDAHLALDSATPAGCRLYSSWTCKAEQGALLCTSTCGGKKLSCTNGGTCICGVGFSPCSGTYTASSPCDVCRAAWLGGCCL